MKVLIDGKEVQFQNDVEIVYEPDDLGTDSDRLHIKATHEGIIKDIWGGDERNKATSSEMAEDIYDDMLEQDESP